MTMMKVVVPVECLYIKIVVLKNIFMKTAT